MDAIATLAAVIGALYVFTMLCVFMWYCMTRTRSVHSVDQAGLIESGEVVVVTTASPYVAAPKVRTVQRGRTPFASVSYGAATGVMDLGQIERQIRLGFVRKVYALLSTQLLVTAGTILIFLSCAFDNWNKDSPTAFGNGVLNNAWVIWAAFVPMLVLLCFLHGVKNTYPVNYIGLFLFTAAEGCCLGIVCVAYYRLGFGEQIVLAAGLTVGVFLVLTLFTMQSKIDWNFLGPGLVACLFILCFWSWFTFLLPISVVTSFQYQQAFSLIGALLFCGFIIYDTNMIMRHLGVDDYIIAAIELYLDVINLFLFLLRCLTAGGGRS